MLQVSLIFPLSCSLLQLLLHFVGAETSWNLHWVQSCLVPSLAFGHIAAVLKQCWTVLKSVEKSVEDKICLLAAWLLQWCCCVLVEVHWKIPVLQCALFFSLPRIIVTSSSFKLVSLEIYWRLWSSHKSLRYFFVRRDQKCSL